MSVVIVDKPAIVSSDSSSSGRSRKRLFGTTRTLSVDASRGRGHRCPSRPTDLDSGSGPL